MLPDLMVIVMAAGAAAVGFGVGYLRGRRDEREEDGGAYSRGFQYGLEAGRRPCKFGLDTTVRSL